MTKQEFKIIDESDIIEIPANLAVCPICGGKLFALNFTDWVEAEDGLYQLIHITLECESEPDIEAPEWDDWFSGHYSMPCVYWLPVCHRVQAWFNRHYRFDLEGVLES